VCLIGQLGTSLLDAWNIVQTTSTLQADLSGLFRSL
jgi:hypothetical protein